jgi:hypothetical protein
MKKLAVFAEGGTEQAFVEKLLLEIGTEKQITIWKERWRGGGKGNPRDRQVSQLMGISPNTQDIEYYVQIIDCGNDERVQSDVIESYPRLVKLGFDSIIGIRDVRPQPPERIPRLKQLLKYKVPTKPVDPVMVLAIMEIEAWFLAEYTHFPRVHPNLTLARVRAIAGFDPSVDDVEQRLQPADDLDLIYQAVGERYEKTPASIQCTIAALDSAVIYLDLSQRVPALKPLVDAIDAFLS